MVSGVSAPQWGQRMVDSVTGMAGIYDPFADRGRRCLAHKADAG
jgi:hypothetical protein